MFSLRKSITYLRQILYYLNGPWAYAFIIWGYPTRVLASFVAKDLSEKTRLFCAIYFNRCFVKDAMDIILVCAAYFNAPCFHRVT